MKESVKDGLHLFSFERLNVFPRIRHFVSSRPGGISEQEFSSLNLGFHVGDSSFDVLQNRRILADALGMGLFSFTFANQCHSANVALVDERSKGLGAVARESAIPNTDGMITNIPGICLCVLVADCVPILLYDPQKQVIAALHAGWKGALRKIAPAAIEKMIQNYGCRADDILACLGPSNGPCCYEVGEDVAREARCALGNPKGVLSDAPTKGKFIFDQWQANKLQLIEYGVKESHIEVAGICTQCNASLFYSSRADKGVTGRFAAGIMLMI